MARVTIPLAEYQEGRLPPVCMISGEPTEDVFVYRTGVGRRREGRADPGGALRALEDLVDRIDVRQPRDVLLGRIPVAAEVQRRLDRVGKLAAWALAASLVTLTFVAWAGADWSPPVAILAVAAGGVSITQRRKTRRVLPRPTLTHGGSLVTVDNVHDSFAHAVLRQP